MRRLLPLLTFFWASRRANVAVTFALLLVPLLGAAGAVVDYSLAVSARAQAMAAADSALLAGLKQAQTAFGSTTNTLTASQILSAASAAAQQIFWAGVTSNIPGATLRSPVVTYTKSGQTLSGTLNFTGTEKTTLLSLVGVNTLPVTGQDAATLTLPTYINYYILVDISQSMGLAATTADQAALYNRTLANGNGGCTFGCHVRLNVVGMSNEQLAHNISPYITLRIDSAVSAIKAIIADASASSPGGNVKIGLYTMSQDPVTGNYLNTISTPSSAYASLTTLAGTIDLGNNNISGTGDSNFSTQIAYFNNLLTAQGDGSAAASPLNFVFLVTDGVQDVFGAGCSSTHCTSAFDPSLCNPLKAKGTVGVIYTTYLPIYLSNDSALGYDPTYSTLVLPFAGSIAPNLQSCATSSSYYYEASDGPAITTAMKALFASTQQVARVTQ